MSRDQEEVLRPSVPVVSREGIEDMIQLSGEQLAAAHGSIDANIAVTAGAGTGKTATLVARAHWLIEQGVAPEKILCVTFTRAAANEIEDRLDATHEKCGMNAITVAALAMSTCESKQGKDALLPISMGQLESLLPGLRDQFGDQRGTKAAFMAEHASEIDYWLEKSGRATQDRILKDAVAIALDLDGPVYDFMLIDEAQDLTCREWRLVTSLARYWYAVGDARQSLYGWRGSIGGAFEALADQRFELMMNYRSCTSIVYRANEHMPEHSPLLADVEECGHVIEIGLEPYMIVNHLIKEGWKHEDIAVLVRTNRLADAVSQELRLNDIPCVRINPPSTGVASDWIMSLLCTSMNEHDRDMVAWQTIAPQLVGDRWAELRTLSRRSDVGVGEIIKHAGDVPPFKGNARDILRGIVNTKAFEDRNFPRPPYGVMQLAECLLHRCGDMSVKDLVDWLSRSDQHDWLPTDEHPGVRVSTIHSAKGLEWPVVIVAYANDGYLPMLRKDSDLEEERRVMYVAMTRPESELYLQYDPASDEHGPPSRWLSCGVKI